MSCRFFFCISKISIWNILFKEKKSKDVIDTISLLYINNSKISAMLGFTMDLDIKYSIICFYQTKMFMNYCIPF